MHTHPIETCEFCLGAIEASRNQSWHAIYSTEENSGELLKPGYFDLLVEHKHLEKMTHILAHCKDKIVKLALSKKSIPTEVELISEKPYM